MVAADDPFVGIDLDDCREPQSGLINAQAQTWIDRLDSYTEVTVSRTGIRIRVQADDARRRTGMQGRRRETVEVYAADRYFHCYGPSPSRCARNDRATTGGV